MNNQEDNLFSIENISFFNIKRIHLPWYEIIKKLKTPIELASIFNKNVNGIDDKTIEEFKSISDLIPENAQFLIVLKGEIKQLPTPTSEEQEHLDNISNYVINSLKEIANGNSNITTDVLLDTSLSMLPNDSSYPLLTTKAIGKYIQLAIETYVNQKEKNMEAKLDNNNFCLIDDEIYPIGYNNGKILIPDEKTINNYQFQKPYLLDNNLFKTYEDFENNIGNIINPNTQAFGMK